MAALKSLMSYCSKPRGVGRHGLSQRWRANLCRPTSDQIKSLFLLSGWKSMNQSKSCQPVRSPGCLTLQNFWISSLSVLRDNTSDPHVWIQLWTSCQGLHFPTAFKKIAAIRIGKISSPGKSPATYAMQRKQVISGEILAKKKLKIAQSLYLHAFILTQNFKNPYFILFTYGFCLHIYTSTCVHICIL